jgi:hypothetical protein
VEIRIIETDSLDTPRFSFELNGLAYEPDMEEFVSMNKGKITLEYSRVSLMRVHSQLSIL